MNTRDLFSHPRDTGNLRARQRALPSQPEGADPNRVFAGSDMGEIAYSGEKPQAGDLITIIGQSAQVVALSPQTPGLGMPLFNRPCRCKCPASDGGTIFWGNPIHFGPYLVIMDQNGSFLQTLNPPQLFRVAGIAADSAAPFNFYVLDDRTRLTNFVTDASPDAQIAGISTYALHIFANGGGDYAWASVVELPDPGLPPSPVFVEEMEWVTEGAARGALADPPAAYPTNCMTVIDGTLFITMSMAPARYLSFTGSGFAFHSLSLSGGDFSMGLRGQIVTGIAKPGKGTSRFVLAWLPSGFGEPGAGGFELVEFDANDAVLRHFSADATLVSPTGLFVMCNRVVALSSRYYGRTEDGTDASVSGTKMLGTGGPPVAVLDGLLVDDFCRTHTLSQISKVRSFTGALAGISGTTIAALGCAPVISSLQLPINNAILSTLDKEGGYTAALLTTADAADRGQPGPTSHLYAVPGPPLITGAATNPFPLAAGSFAADYFLGGDLWFTESDGASQLQDAASHTLAGFGGAFAPYWTLKLPPGRVFNGVPTGRLENHSYDNYLLMPVVGFPQEPMSLIWDRTTSLYEWPIGLEALYNLNANRMADATFWLLVLGLNEVNPALLADSGPTLSGNLAIDGFTNGADLHRHYCYAPLAADVVMPDFGHATSATYAISADSLRPALVGYTVSPGADATQPVSFSLTIETVTQSPAAFSLPTNTNDHPYDQAMSFAIPTLTPKTDGSGNHFVGLDWSLSVTGGYSGSGTMRYGPLNPSAEWLATPRYYEARLYFFFRAP